MKKVIVVFYLSLFPFDFVYSQSETDSVCLSNLKNIFKVYKLKIKYETVQYIYDETKKNGGTFYHNSDFLNRSYELITGFPLKEQNDGVKHGKSVEVKKMSKEEINRYIEQLNCTPEQAFQEYKDLIRDIKSEKGIYLNCIEAEIAKGDSSKYARASLLYNFHPPESSLISPPGGPVKTINFLKVFKEFVLNNNEEVLPEGWRVDSYLKKIGANKLKPRMKWSF
jgi:hypothetical protein